jgi:SAM-dependent methyltransferase
MDAGTIEAKEHWQRWHNEQKETALTGSTLDSYCHRLGLNRADFNRHRLILEIGVGRGHATREMVKLGNTVMAMDICPRALETAHKAGAYQVWLHENAAWLPSNMFDLAISHVVTQHMSEADILWQFPHVFRSLVSAGERPPGIFVVQWAGSHVPGENNLTETIVGEEGQPTVQNTPSMLGGRMVRDPEYATKLVERCGGEVLNIRCRAEFPEFSSYWFVTECRRRNG